ncbi:MAG: Zn-dependent hydrolase, partial [Lutibacter sp.]
MKKIVIVLVLTIFFSCKENGSARKPIKQVTVEQNWTEMQKKLSKYVTFKLTSDINVLTENERKMLPILIKAAAIMNELFWYEAYGNKNQLLDSISNEETKKFVEINYGPWDRLDGNIPFIDGVGNKPAGANFYPTDMTKLEFDAFADENKSSLYTFVRRNRDGNLFTIPYHIQFKNEVKEVANLLLEASKLADDPGLKYYLELRAQAFLDDKYQASDLAWMDMKTNSIDIVIGPIETYEDQLYGNKASHEAYVLIKDQVWSEKLAHFAGFLPELQSELPVSEVYKAEIPGTDSDLNAYD